MGSKECGSTWSRIRVNGSLTGVMGGGWGFLNFLLRAFHFFGFRLFLASAAVRTGACCGGDVFPHAGV